MIQHRTFVVQQDEAGTLLAATLCDDGPKVSYLSGADPEKISNIWSVKKPMSQIGNGFLAQGTTTRDGTQNSELAFFQDRNVLLAIRNGEPVEAVVDWLNWHAAQGADGALIFNRAEPGTDTFGVDLERVAKGMSLDVLVVDATAPMGRVDQPDARLPALAPGAPKRLREEKVDINQWHAPFAETVLLETLRHRFLAKASGVAFLDIGDLADGTGATIFDRAQSHPGRYIQLHGVERYPWRLRNKKPAPHSDHIYGRLNETRMIVRWCVDPRSLDPETFWRVTRIGGASFVPEKSGSFVRAMGVVFPGVPINDLVSRSLLIEDAKTCADLSKFFSLAPLKRKVSASVNEAASDTVTVVTVMKNEGPYILDWIAHCRTVGVDRILVYSNDCEDGTDQMLDALADAGVVEHRQNPYRSTGGVPQHAAFRAAENEDAVRSAGWLLTLDVDEYLNIRVGDGHLSDLFAAVPNSNIISMPWRMFGSSDIIDFRDEPVTDQFTECAHEFTPRPHQAWGFKTLYRNTGLFRRLGVHRPKGMVTHRVPDINWVDGSGRPMPQGLWRSGWRMTRTCWGYDLAGVNHYAVRSAESFLVKRERGRVNHVRRDQGLAYWFRMNHNGSEDTSIQRLSPKVLEEKSALLALPKVRELHESSVAWHKARIAALKEQDAYREIFDAITGPKLQRLSRMLSHFGSNVFLAGPEVIPDDVAKRSNDGDWLFTVKLMPRKD
ncbi:MAG: glycosyltransferase family 2 protein [Boseongicola sp.]|nr:glycosyltransferase family 2 protein [Boseongicola sp.]